MKNPIQRVLSFREHDNPGFYGPASRERFLLLACLHEVSQDPAENPPEKYPCPRCGYLFAGREHVTKVGATTVRETWNPETRMPVRHFVP